jgi:hypothetical protein
MAARRKRLNTLRRDRSGTPRFSATRRDNTLRDSIDTSHQAAENARERPAGASYRIRLASSPEKMADSVK